MLESGSSFSLGSVLDLFFFNFRIFFSPGSDLMPINHTYGEMVTSRQGNKNNGSFNDFNNFGREIWDGITKGSITLNK